MSRIKAVMVAHNKVMEVVAVLTLHSLPNIPENRLIVESYIEQCPGFVDVQELELCIKKFYGKHCFVAIKMIVE